jgi:hypothetical protein
MRVTEAAWIARQLAQLGHDRISPLINVGASTAAFRTVHQPHIDRMIFAPLREAHVEVIHCDLKRADGVDVAGDLMDTEIQKELRGRRPRAVLASNLLEHVVEPQGFAHAMASLLSPGGLLIVTVPRSYPYHADPIDTGFRPTPEELSSLFAPCDVVASDVVNDTTYARELVTKPRRGIRNLLGALRGRGESGRAQRDRLRWLFRPFTTSCVVLQPTARTIVT